MNDCIVIVPAYKSHLNNYEYVSFARCCKLLSKDYTICLLTYPRMNLSEYTKIFNKYADTQNMQLTQLYFNKEYFNSPLTYSLIMLEHKLYNTFKNYKYILIYQLDCYIFKNDIKIWIDKDYPQCECINFAKNSNSSDLEAYFNGQGLRRIDAFLNFFENNIELVNSFRTQILSSIIFKCFGIYNGLTKNTWLMYKMGEGRFFTKYISNDKIFGDIIDFGRSERKQELYEQTQTIPTMINHFNKHDEWSKQMIGDPDKDKEACINRNF